MELSEIENAFLVEEVSEYMKWRDKHFKPYGYFMFYNQRCRQIMFQRIRHHKRLCKYFFKRLKSFPDDFFSNPYSYEARVFLGDMLPRRNEYILHYEEYLEICSNLNDDESKRTLFSIMNSALSLRYEGFERCSIKGVGTDYYPKDIMPEFGHRVKEVIIDCGGCDGDTAQWMIDRFGTENIEAYHLMEPDINNINRAKIRLKQYAVMNYVQAAVGDRSGVVRFDPIGGASGRLDKDHGTISVPMISIDEYIRGRVTYIKMDIEGAERQAIAGASETIRKYKPKLAICLYHFPDDIRIIIKQIRALNPDYKLYIRHYSSKHKETVLYCL